MTTATRVSRLNRIRAQVSKLEGDLFDYDFPGQRTVIGIDASLTNFGISIYGVDKEQHATLLFKPKTKGVARLDEIYWFVRRIVTEVAKNTDLQHIVMEAYAMGIRGGKTFSIGEGGGVVKLALLQYFGSDSPLAYPTLVSPAAVKKFTTGKGTSKKNEMLLAVYRKWDVEFSSDDMADAYSLARIGAAILSGQTEYGYEGEVVAALERHTEWATS